MPSLYVCETGARIEIEHQRLLVTREDDVLLRVPLGDIQQVVLVGAVGVTTPAMAKLLDLNIPLMFLNSRGKFLGRLTTPTSYNLPLRQEQYRKNDDAGFGLNLARCIVRGKVHNQYIQVKRWSRRHSLSPGGPNDLMQCCTRAEAATEMEELLGIEGNAARIYFSLLEQVLDTGWNFHNRNRRPPKDPVNALLSLGYTLLTYTLSSALEVVGLDPYLGYYHVEQYGRPALALDLLEEFRAPVVDSLAVSLVNRGQLALDDFETDAETGGQFLTRHGWRVFAHHFTRKLETTLHLPGIQRPLSYQKIFEVQARKLARLIQGKESSYHPFWAR